MKRNLRNMGLNGLVISLLLAGLTGTAAGSNVCGRGLGQPPFLSYAIDSNLLMLIDNSGSMLDTAYTDPDMSCYDDNFMLDPVSGLSRPADFTYAGNLAVTDPDLGTAWYKWVAPIESWSHKTYAAGDLVYTNGAIYKAKTVTGAASVGATIYYDTSVEWEPLQRLSWTSGTYYHANSFIFSAGTGRLYHTIAGGTSAGDTLLTDAGVTWTVVDKWANGTVYSKNAYVMWKETVYQAVSSPDGNWISIGTKPWDDEGVQWEEINPFQWQTGADYRSGNIVTQDSMFFRATANHTSSGATIYEDDFAANWERIDEGYFEMISAADASTQCNAAVAAGITQYKHSDLCLTLANGVTPKQMTFFAASGNMLNWLSASKFDIQKSILTGGKYNASIQRLVSENRGCSGWRFIKQMLLDNGEYLLISIRGSRNTEELTRRDRIDNADDTSRIEILGVSATGYDSASCQTAADCVLEGGDALGCQGSIDQCLSGTGTAADARAALNHSLQYCSQNSPKIKPTLDNCLSLYPQLNPNQIANYSNAYSCYGIYDADRRHDSDRIGFIGRCWALGTSASGSTCDAHTKDTTRCGGAEPCEYQFTDPGGMLHLLKNDSTSPYTQRCYMWKNASDITKGCQNAQKWEIFRTDSLSGAWCDPNDPIYTVGGGGTGAAFSSDLDGVSGVTASDTALVPSPLPDEFDPNNTGLTDEAAYCVYEALEDYCDSLTTPQVIDPSDQTTTTTDEYGNVPALLIDSGVLSQLGVDVPIAVMKGYSLPPPDPDDASQRLEPTGLLQEQREGLRIGAMAFNSVGASTECDLEASTTRMEEYCPSGNSDGAQVISPIKLATQVIDDKGTADTTDDIIQLDVLVDAINGVRATSWTPLAEAMYNAIGYYTQNNQLRLSNNDNNNKDFQVDSEVGNWQNNVLYGRGFYALAPDPVDPAKFNIYQTFSGGRSDGTSLADDTKLGWTKVGRFRDNWAAGTAYIAKDIVLSTDDNKHYITYAGGTSRLKAGAPASDPKYDQDVLWEPLLDPVVNYCQDNNILIITEGASTADINPDVYRFIEGTHVFNTKAIMDDATADPAPAGQCSNGLLGSTYLDNITYFGQNAGDTFQLYPTGNGSLPLADPPYTMQPKHTLKTYVVVSGSMRSGTAQATDPAECEPEPLMRDAALNGGTEDYILGEDPATLKNKLTTLFNALRERASAGSAASVISSARGGEGAIYQAIFWPELKRSNGTDDMSVTWAGDVHGLFLDNRGYMYEDTNGDRKLTPYEDLDGDGHMDVNEARGEDIDGDGHYDCVNEDVDGDGHLDVFEDTIVVNGDLDPGEDIDGDGTLDTVWNDLDGDGVKDPGEGEDLDGDGYLDTGEDINHNGGDPEPGEDINGDGVLQFTEDLDGEGCGADAFDPFVDVDHDGHQDVNEDLNGNGRFDDDPSRDHRVVIFFDEASGRSKACYNSSVFSGTCDATATKELNEVKFLWSANGWLADSAMNTAVNRGTYISNEKKRYMFTWNDLNNDGIVDSGEVLPLESSVDWAGLSYNAANRGSVVNDFDASSDAEVDMIVNWLRGNDWLIDENDPNGNDILDAGEPTDLNGNGIIDAPQRSRQIPATEGTNDLITWRLGDIIHSTPMTVAAPAEGYHLIYNDFSYAQFLAKYKGRRHVVYFGGNDGFLHAVNAGFYSEAEKRFCLYALDGNGNCTEPCPEALDADGECPETATWPKEYADAPALGAELWAYLPYNLQPHVKCLTDPAYNHKYFVDLRPRIFDAQIFREEAACRKIVDGDQVSDFGAAGCIHPNGWGTIMVNGLRFGGTRTRAIDLNGNAADQREFISSYSIIDITEPDDPPVLLGELSRIRGTHVNLGYSAMIPTMVIMKEDNADPTPDVNKWYLMLGSGPRDNYPPAIEEAIKGISNQSAKIAVLPLEWLTGKDTGSKTGVRIPDANPVSAESGGRWDLGSYDPWPTRGFVNDAITVDFDINPSYKDYKADAVYFGTVQGDFATNVSGTTYWRGGGLMYRLVTKNILGGVSPIGRYTTEGVTEPQQWQIKPLIDLQYNTVWPSDPDKPNQPVTAAASVGTDGENFWIYFGTGRFFDADDKTDTIQQAYYGIKEPMIKSLYDHDSNPLTPARDVFALTWEKVERTGTSTNPPGGRGLQDVSDILVKESPSIKTATLSCRSVGCLPAGISTLYDLDKYIAGTGSCSDTPPENCVDGWYTNFYPYFNREKNVGQATLLGGLVTFTTYQPFNDVCQAEGNAFLYGVYYRTGTAWHQNVFGYNGVSDGNVEAKQDLGRGLATTPNLHVGSGTGEDEGTKAFVQTSTGEIKEIEQKNLPIKVYRTGRSLWKEYLE